ncbi:MAG: hypothetical protein HYX87_00305 [Chloroflexi bacterium]|nr:hypothetical protein [Chloroflexota bacterium]
MDIETDVDSDIDADMVAGTEAEEKFDLNGEDLAQVVRVARVLCPGFEEDKLQALFSVQRRLTNAGFLDAIVGLVRFQQEQGISPSEALDAYRELVAQEKSLEGQLAGLKEKVAQEQQRHEAVSKERQRVSNALDTARGELKRAQDDITKAQQQILFLQRKIEATRRQTEVELEECRKGAGVAREEIAAAGKLKQAVEDSSFSLEAMLGLVEEFAPYQDARDRLAEALKTCCSLTHYIYELQAQAEERTDDFDEAISQLVAQKSDEEAKVNQLRESRRQLERDVAKLQEDREQEQELRQFYVRYHPVTGLIDYLASWPQVLFYRCDNPFCAPFAGITRFWTDKSATRCPHCGLGPLIPDPEPFRMLNQPMGSSFRLRLR